MVDLVYKFDKKSYRECLFIAKVIFNFFCPQTYGHQHRSLYPAGAARVKYIFNTIHATVRES